MVWLKHYSTVVLGGRLLELMSAACLLLSSLVSLVHTAAGSCGQHAVFMLFCSIL
jgi:hypothetical protein